MKKIILLLAVAFSMLLPTTLIAQESSEQATQTAPKQSFFKLSNLTYGGNFGFHLDSHEFNVLLCQRSVTNFSHAGKCL